MVGFDIADNMIRVCHSKYGERDSVELMLADIEHLPLKPNSFDAALAIDMLVYVSDTSRKVCLENMANLVSLGGIIIVEVKMSVPSMPSI